ncbi:YbaY family lipoprotein [Pseudomonas sp. RIT-PI-S]|uniref:YbaY family lipoprotein n=1 Tax=Pseudomonas sp. RIT-PI-S TaxID=3035295 RepID=UPI0021D928C7|nr:YbaY family lipoprotein [Pseudomonas sp. RIT-PI-S]
MSTAKLTGHIHYMTRELLPEVTLTVTLKEVSARGIAEKTIASMARLVSAGGPLTYRLDYDPRSVVPARGYLVIAEVHHRDRPHKRGVSEKLTDLYATTHLDVEVTAVASEGIHGWSPIENPAVPGIHGGNLIDNPPVAGIHGGNLFDKP